MAGTTKTGVRG